MRQAVRILRETVAAHPRYVVAYSGGTDSSVLLDLVARYAPAPPVAVVFVSTGLEPEETRQHVAETVAGYGFRLHAVSPARAYREQWDRSGFPMLGKASARDWQRQHPGAGFRVDCSACCKALKLEPGRKATRALGASLQLVGTRGSADSRSRGFRTLKDGTSYYTRDGLMVAKPLDGWTDLRLRWYVDRFRLRLNPVTLRGGEAGCLPCGGGGQFTSSSLRRMRLHHPEAWRRYVLEEELGYVLLAVRYGTTLSAARRAVALLGELDAVPPHVFDFLRPTPLPGYEKPAGPETEAA